MRGRGCVEIPGWGWLRAVWEAGKLLYLGLEEAMPAEKPADNADPFLREISRQAGAYLQGRLHRLDLPYTLPDLPAFCGKVWRAALEIPYGQVISYGALAARAGNPRAARAAGYAMSINRLFLIVPCHRVIADNGKLGGYGGRPHLKARLLTLEGLTVREGKVL